MLEPFHWTDLIWISVYLIVFPIVFWQAKVLWQSYVQPLWVEDLRPIVLAAWRKFEKLLGI